MSRKLLAVMDEEVKENQAIIREPLKLNIYDLTRLNKYLYWLGLGAYHSAVEAYGSEYAYGAHEYSTSGVFEVQPRQCPGFRFRKSLMLGTLWMGPEEFKEFVEGITSQYTGDSYSLLFKNCNHFCDDICMRLVNIQIPRWVNRLAKIGLLLSCFSPRSLKIDGYHDYHRDQYGNEAELIQYEIEPLASSLAIVPSKRKQLGSLAALLQSSRRRNPFRERKIHDVSKQLSLEELKKL